MATAIQERTGPVTALGGMAYNAIDALGDIGIFAALMIGWMVRRRPARGTLINSFYQVGVNSVPVVAITGMFIGMVMAVQYYSQFQNIGLATKLGAVINISLVRELGPVLAATMIAGRVGSAMAAELGTMRITEQVDALTCLGLNPLYYLVVPRFLACVLLIPLLAVLADFMGIMGGGLICTKVYQVEAHHYWANAQEYVGVWDISTGLFKSMFFGAAIAIVSCHRGMNCRPGAEGVGKAATEAFVFSFITILVLDFFLALFLNAIYGRLWPTMGPRLI